MKDNTEAVHPLDYRYGDETIKRIFSQSNKFRIMLLIEGKVAEAQSEFGLIPKWAGSIISEKSKEGISLEKIWEKEKETRHEVAAMVSCLEELAGEGGRYVHFGLTSNDIIDTATLLQISEAGNRILEMTKALGLLLAKRANETRRLLCVARTHGMHAEVYTYGIRFSVWLSEVVRSYQRISNAISDARVGKISGAVGTYVGMGENGMKVEERVLSEFGLRRLQVTTQVVPRDIFSSVIMQLAALSSVLDRMATNVRNLQRTEISEVSEARSEQQVGSSAMPQKMNPIGSEKVSGLARIVRSLALASLENISLWDERDLTNSSTERVMFPETFGLVSEQLKTMIEVMEGLKLNDDQIRKNLDLNAGEIYSEFIMRAMVESGMGRAQAHKMMREAIAQSRKSGVDLLTLLLKDQVVVSKLGEPRLKALMDPRVVLPFSEKIVNGTVTEAGGILQVTQESY